MNKDDIAQLLEDAYILRQGISEEALELLEKRFGYNLDIFQLVDAYGRQREQSADKIIMEAQKRDGQLSVIRWIKQTRKLKPKKKEEQ